MAVDADALWYVQRGLKRLPKGSTTPEEIDAKGFYVAQAIDEHALYGELFGEQILRFDKATRKVTTLASSAHGLIFSLAVGPDRVWFSRGSELWCVPKDGSGSPVRWTGAVSDAPGEHHGPSDLVVVRDTVYFLADEGLWSVGA